jgi:uncharacterized membrane protein YbhN (UPF0104 family)
MADGRRHLVAAGGVLVSAVALFFVTRSIDVGEAARVLASVDPVLLAAIGAIVAVEVALRAFRWSVLLPRRTDGRRILVPRLVPPLLAGYLGNAVLPARLGEPMRAVLVSRRESIDMAGALGSVLVERVVDIATLAPLAFIAAQLVGVPGWLDQILGLTTFGGLVLLVILLTVGAAPLVRLALLVIPDSRHGLRDAVGRFGASLGGRGRRPHVLVAALISSIAWLLDAVSVWLGATAIGVAIDYPAAMLVAGIGTLGTAIPSAPGYVGTYELAMAGIAALVGVPPAAALALAVLIHVMTLGLVAVGGAVSVMIMGADLREVARDAEASSRRGATRA